MQFLLLVLLSILLLAAFFAIPAVADPKKSPETTNGRQILNIVKEVALIYAPMDDIETWIL